MFVDYPNDADGDSLRRIAAGGSDMTKPMDIEFAIAVPNESAADLVGDAASGLSYSYRSDLYYDEEDRLGAFTARNVWSRHTKMYSRVSSRWTS